MDKLSRVLWSLLWGFIGVFIGSSACRWHDYAVRPELYAMQSAPWYLGIAVHAVFTAAVCAVLLLCIWIIKRRQDAG